MLQRFPNMGYVNEAAMRGAAASAAPKEISIKARLVDIAARTSTLRNHAGMLVETWYGGQPTPGLATVDRPPETFPDYLDDIEQNLRRLSDHLEFLSARA